MVRFNHALRGAAVALALTVPAHAESDAAIRQTIIRESLSNYSGRCPCPYNTMSNGASCGGRSAYSRPGGAAPICYPSDVTPAMISAWRLTHRGN